MLTVVAVLLPLAACKSSSSGNRTPAAPSAGATRPATTATKTPAGNIRSVDLRNQPDVQKLMADTGGQFVATDVLYADLTGDGVEEAVVPAASGGTLGDVGFVVLTPDNGGAKALLTEAPRGTRGVAVHVEGGLLVETQSMPGPDDPECCPSQVTITTYRWDGSRLVVGSVERQRQGAAPGKGTPVAGGATPVSP